MQKTYHRLRVLLKQLPTAQLRVDRARSKATIRSRRYSDRIQGGTVSNPVEDGVIALDAAQGALQLLQKEIAYLQEKVKPHIDTVQPPFAREVMKMRYLDGTPARVIAWRTGYTEQHIHYLIRNGERTPL